jgi:hypothetical protein
MEVAWDEGQQLWRGTATLGPDGPVGVVVVPGRGDRDTALAYARFALALVGSCVRQAREYAAAELLGYYNYSQAHRSEGEQLTAEEFAERLRLEGIRFGREGHARLYFGHSLYRDDYQLEGGLVVVEATAEGEFRRTYWVTEPDAREPRRIIRGT